MALTHGPAQPAPEQPKTCLNCPSFRTTGQFARENPTLSPIDGPVCMSFAKLLAMPTFSADETKAALESTAESCPSFGQPWRPVHDYSLVKIGENGTAEVEAIGATDRQVTTCRQCRFFNPASRAGADLGLSSPLCHAKGSLILGNLVQTAKDCAFSKGIDLALGAYSYQPTDISLFPDLVPAAAGPYSTGVPVLDIPQTVIEPSQYPSDYPVDPADQAEGIRAWRKVFDPREPRRAVLMPIFEAAFFTEEERAKIPQSGSDEHPELYIDYSESVYKVLVLWLELDETPAVWGAAGVGKTELFRHLAWMMQLPFERISVTATTEVDDLAGKMLFSPDLGTHFTYGRIPKAWTKPSVICLDEPNVGPPEVWEFCRPLTDNSKQLVLDAHKGERIERHKFCYMGMAMNPAWDPKNIGAESVADADSSRLMHLYIDNPPRSVEAKILQDRLALDGWQLSDKSLTQVMLVANDIRKLCDQGTLPITWGVRHQIKATRALKWFTPRDAYAIACADFLEPQQRSIILDLVSTTLESL